MPIPTTMHAMVLAAPRQALSLQERLVPRPGTKEVLGPEVD